MGILKDILYILFQVSKERLEDVSNIITNKIRMHLLAHFLWFQKKPPFGNGTFIS